MSCQPNTFADKAACAKHNKPAMDIKQGCLSSGFCKMENGLCAPLGKSSFVKQYCDTYNMQHEASKMSIGIDCLQEATPVFNVKRCKWNGGRPYP